MGVIRG